MTIAHIAGAGRGCGDHSAWKTWSQHGRVSIVRFVFLDQSWSSHTENEPLNNENLVPIWTSFHYHVRFLVQSGNLICTVIGQRELQTQSSPIKVAIKSTKKLKKNEKNYLKMYTLASKYLEELTSFHRKALEDNNVDQNEYKKLC